MAKRLKQINIELSKLGIDDRSSIFASLGNWSEIVRFVLLWQGVIIEAIDVDLRGKPHLSFSQLYDLFLQMAFPHSYKTLGQQMLRERLLQQEPSHDDQSWKLDITQLASKLPIDLIQSSLTIAVCISTKSIPDSNQLEALFSSLSQQHYSSLQILIIEYGGMTTRLRELVKAQPTQISSFEYYPVTDGSLALAQQMAIEKAQGDIIGFVGDRTVVDANWSCEIAGLFDRNPDVAVVAGLTLPQSMETDRQAWHEAMYGKAHGFKRQWIRWNDLPNWMELGVMQYASDVNFALRRSVKIEVEFHSIWEMITQILIQGATLVYEPRAIVSIEVPATDREIEAKSYREIRSFYQYLKQIFHQYPKLRFKILILGLWKLLRVLSAYIKGYGLPRSWFRSELLGIWHETVSRKPIEKSRMIKAQIDSPNPSRLTGQVAVIDLSQPLYTIETNAEILRLYAKWKDRLLGFVEIPSHGYVGIDCICDALIDKLFIQILSIAYDKNASRAWMSYEQHCNTYFAPRPTLEPPPQVKATDRLPDHISVTIIVPTCNRPDDLRNCLNYLKQIQTNRPIEIVVADNRPKSASAAPVLKDFPGVKLVEEHRAGSSYARNAAIVASTGDIVVAIDDDVIVPPDWLEKLLVPFARPEVMCVYGGVLPSVLDTPAQLMFEQFRGGLCFGYDKWEADRNWLDSYTDCVPPIWRLGVSANAAFRSNIFLDPTIGLMEETLGVGMPSCSGEENHFTYKILRAGHSIVYDPGAYVYHRHRQTVKQFYKQLQGYMTSCSALLMTLWLKEGDLRGRRHLLLNMPRYLWECWRDRILGKDTTPWPILYHELKGYIIGFRGYFKSQKVVQKRGRSSAYIHPNDR